MAGRLQGNPPASPTPDLPAGVQPALADLLALRRPAAGLPALARTARTRQRGLFSAPPKGRGMEYAESRPYQPGDDVRALDWRVTARTGRPHTKLFQEERERPVYLALDLRPGMAFATRGVFKSVLAARTAALIAWKTVADHDRVGGVLMGPAGIVDLPPARGQLGAMRFLKGCVEVAAQVPTAPLALHALSGRLARLVRPGSLVFVLGDFRDLDRSAEADFARIALHSDVVFLACEDPFERALPAFDASLRVTHGGLSRTVALGSEEQSRRYAGQATARDARLEGFTRQHRVGLLRLSTDADPLASLVKHYA